MIGAEAMPVLAPEVVAGNRRAGLLDDFAQRDTPLIARLLLALVLAGMSVLIPGEASRFLETELDPFDIFRRTHAR